MSVIFQLDYNDGELSEWKAIKELPNHIPSLTPIEIGLIEHVLDHEDIQEITVRTTKLEARCRKPF